jgi:hypothetical protein
VRRERVAEPVRVPQDSPHGARVQAFPAGGEEERVLGAAGERRPRFS